MTDDSYPKRDEKVREFWIVCPEFGDHDYCESIMSKDPNCITTEADFKFNAIHVIEYSAYERLRKELDDYKSLWSRINKDVLPGEIDSIDAMVNLVKERDAAIKTLKILANPPFAELPGNIIRRFFKSIGKDWANDE